MCYERPAAILESLREKVHQLGFNTLSQQKEALRPLFEKTIVGVDKNGNFLYEYFLCDEKGAKFQVCREAWARAHNVSKTMLETLAVEMKEGVISKSRKISERSHQINSVEQLQKILEDNNLKCTKDYIRDAILKGTDAERECYHWFDEFFRFSGDQMPNSNQIHIESVTYISLYNQYKKESFYEVNYKNWKFIWDTLFSNVKMRTYKQVTGKCETCALLTGLRSRYTHPVLKQLVTDLHELHRLTYMAERHKYYDRRIEAINSPDEIMSGISDGMAQCHTSLPWYGGKCGCADTIDQKLMGFIDHGRNKFHIFMCMHTLPGNANLNAHVFLLALEDWIKDKNKYPRKIYWQVDGGPENANKTILGIPK